MWGIIDSFVLTLICVALVNSKGIFYSEMGFFVIVPFEKYGREEEENPKVCTAT